MFVGVPISLTLLSRSYNPPLDFTFLSGVFSGRRRLDSISVAMALLMAKALGMDFAAFCAEVGNGNFGKCHEPERHTNNTLRGLQYR